MKSKAQKNIELKEAEELLKNSSSLVFVDFNKVTAEELRRLRREVGEAGNKTMVLKKRLLNVLFKGKNVDMDARQFKSSVGTIFSGKDFESASGSIYKFFNSLGGTDKELKVAAMKKLLGGYDLVKKEFADAKKITYYGQLPSREVALTMVLQMFVGPLRSFMYLVSEKSRLASSQ